MSTAVRGFIPAKPSPISRHVLQKLHTCGRLRCKLKWFYELDNRRKRGRASGGRESGEKPSKLDCLFPPSVSDSSVWVTGPLSRCVSTSLALWLPLCKQRRTGEREREGGIKEEETCFHGDGWWKRRRKVLLGCTPLHLSSPASIAPPPSNSMSFSSSTSFKRPHFWAFQIFPSFPFILI